MIMIRNTMLALSFLALTGVSAVAAPAVHHSTTRVVAQDAPADAKPAKKEKKAKKAKKADAPKGDKAAAPEAK
jgi:hypothetical protein